MGANKLDFNSQLGVLSKTLHGEGDTRRGWARYIVLKSHKNMTYYILLSKSKFNPLAGLYVAEIYVC